MTCKAPDGNCRLCSRLVAFREENRRSFPDRFNAPVPAFGSDDPLLLVVGLAPGLRGANFSGRPFTGDYAGEVLYPALQKHGFATGVYDRRADDGFTLKDTRITNAVRCVPPENKPTGTEISACLPFLESEIRSFRRLRAIVALGTVAHGSVLRACGLPAASAKFGHGKTHPLPVGKNVVLFDSYHCSRYNINTGRLTPAMFEDVVAAAKKHLGRPATPAGQ